jgi:hypothetical protein
MLSRFFIPVAALVFILAVPGFSADRLLKYIPADTTMEFTVDPASLLLKAGVNDLASLDVVRESLSNIDDPSQRAIVERYLRDPASTGFDPSTRLHVFVTSLDIPDGSSPSAATNGNAETLLGFVIGLSDAGKFEDFLHSAGFTPLPAKKSGTMRTVFLTNVILAWNDEAAVALSLSNSESESDADNRVSLILNSDEKSGLVSNPSFADQQSRTWDLSLWMAVGKLMEKEKGLLEKNAGDLSEEILDSVRNMDLSMSLDFRPGETRLDIAAHITNNPMQDWKSFLKPFDRKFLSNFGGSDVSAAFSFSYNMSAYMKVLEKYLDKIPDIQKSLPEIEDGLGVPLTNLLNSFAIDGMFTLSGLDVVKQKFTLLGGFTLKDKKPIQKVLDNLVKTEGIVQKKSGKNVYYAFPSGSKNPDAEDVPIYLFLKDNAVFIASADERDRVLAGKKAGNLPGNITALATDHTVQLYISADVLKGIPTDSDEGELVKEIEDNIRSLTVTADTADANESICRLTIATTNPQENSLQVLLRWAAKVAAAENTKKEQIRKNHEDNGDIDKNGAPDLPDNWWKHADSSHYHQ